MIRNTKARLAVGAILGGCAGLSLTSSVIPTALSTLGLGDMFLTRFALSGYAAHTTLFWAAGGWAVVKIDHPIIGAGILGLVGAVSGLLLSIIALDTELVVLLSTIVVCTLYAFVGGLLLGTVLRSPAPESPTEGD